MNSQRILSAILELKWFIVFSVTLGLGIGFGFELKIRRMDTPAEYKLLGLFNEMKDREIAWYAVGLVRVIFVITVGCFYTSIQSKELVMYLLLCLIYNVLHFQPKNIFFEGINSIVLIFLLYLATFLKSYLLDTTMEWKIITVYSLLILFLALDSIIMYLKDIISLLRRKTI